MLYHKIGSTFHSWHLLHVCQGGDKQVTLTDWLASSDTPHLQRERLCRAQSSECYNSELRSICTHDRVRSPNGMTVIKQSVRLSWCAEATWCSLLRAWVCNFSLLKRKQAPPAVSTPVACRHAERHRLLLQNPGATAQTAHLAGVDTSRSKNVGDADLSEIATRPDQCASRLDLSNQHKMTSLVFRPSAIRHVVSKLMPATEPSCA